MMTQKNLHKKTHIINNDVNWKNINKTNTAITIAVTTIFLITIQLTVMI